MIDEVIKGLPLHFQKKNTIKFLKCLKPCVDYIDILLEELKSQTSLFYAQGIFLDYIGEHYQEYRNARDDETYRQSLIIKKTAQEGLPTTEFLLDITRKLTGHKVTAIKTKYKGEVASQLFRVDMLEKLSDINKMPDLNKIAEAGAKMYWHIDINSEELTGYFNSLLQISRKFDLTGDFEINQNMNIRVEAYRYTALGMTRKIEIGGKK